MKSASIVEVSSDNSEFETILSAVEHSMSLVETNYVQRNVEVIGDTGATDHTTPFSEALVNFHSFSSSGPTVTSAFGDKSSAIGAGNLGGLPGECLVLPKSTKTLVSIPTLDKNGISTIIHKGALLSFRPDIKNSDLICNIMSEVKSNYQTVFRADLVNGLYRSTLSALSSPEANIALYPRVECHNKAELVRAMHESLKHCPMNTIRTIAANGMIKG
jgi:hypothetical protein